jgi:AAA15 family ATPase/GTPase
MLENISIENFKGIKSLDMPLSPFTLISGENNVGKTSVLEAVYLMCIHKHPNVFDLMSNIRKPRENNNPDVRDIWGYLFYNYKTKESLSISYKNKITEEKLVLKRDDEWDARKLISELPDRNAPTGVMFTVSQPLLSIYTVGNQKIISRYVIRKSSNGIPQVILLPESSLTTINEPLPVTYFANDQISFNESLPDLVGELIRYKQIQNLVDILKNLDPRINNIVLGEKQRIYLDVGLEEMIPLSSMGSGIANIINWATIILRNKADILLIDEIGNGIHYSSMESVISELGKVGEKYNCQIIATTHSLDAVKAFSAYADKNPERSGYVRLERDKKTPAIIAKSIDSDGLKRMLNSEWEVR